MDRQTHLDMWVREVHRKIVGLSFKVEETLFSQRSAFQQIDVVRTTGHGRMLLNDGVIMLCERDEFAYHEMIAHVPLFVHPEPREVLIVGGGDGGTAREVLRHPGMHAVLVEIDRVVVEACRRHLPEVAGALDDPRLELHITDGVRFMAETQRRFDVVIVDSTDPVGPAEPLFNREFYRHVARVLNPDGILITQAESPYYDSEIQFGMLENQRPFFRRLHLYLFANLTYPGGLWGLGFASKRLCPLRDFDPRRVEQAGMALRYYNAGLHRAAFMLPTFVQENLGGLIDPLPPM